MNNMLRLEINKALRNKFFLISILIGCAITMLSLLYNIGVYQNHLYAQEQIKQFSETVINPLSPMFSLFNHWIGGEPFSLGSSIFFLVFPLLVTIPYGWSYCEEKTSGYTRNVVARSGRSAYFLTKYIAVFISGGLAIVIPLIFNFLLAAMFFPAIVPEVIYDTSYGVFGGSLMSMFYYTKPILYVLCYLGIDLIFGGLIACISLGISSFIKYRVVVVILPLFLFLSLHYSRQFVYSSATTTYKEISPLFFLRPVLSEYNASWLIIIIEMSVLFIITFLLNVVWEKKHEIY